MEPIDPIPGEYAIVELFGHTTLVGRISEVEQFGVKMLAIEPLFAGAMLPAVFHGGAAIYRLTPCSFEVAWQKQPTRGYQLPPPILAIVPPLLIEKAQEPAARHMADVWGAFDAAHDEDEGLPL